VTRRQELLDAEDERWRELEARFHRLAEADWLRPGANGEWTPKDLLTHTAAWHALTTDRLESLRTTGLLPPLTQEVDEFNAAQYEQSRGLPLHEALAMSSAARHRFREEVALLPDDPGEKLAGMIYSNADGHYQEHIPHMDAFLGVE
jgi:hypothetical protein